MATYTVTGYDETVKNVDVLGELKYVGDTVELTEEAAAPLVAEGKLAPLGDGASLSPTAPSLPPAQSQQVSDSQTPLGGSDTELHKVEVTSDGTGEQTVPITTVPPIA